MIYRVLTTRSACIACNHILLTCKPLPGSQVQMRGISKQCSISAGVSHACLIYRLCVCKGVCYWDVPLSCDCAVLQKQIDTNAPENKALTHMQPHPNIREAGGLCSLTESVVCATFTSSCWQSKPFSFSSFVCVSTEPAALKSHSATENAIAQSFAQSALNISEYIGQNTLNWIISHNM